jgi:hypothetical protein
MEQLNMVLQSLSPYVVVSLTGDPTKSSFAAAWGSRSPMPNVWINKFNTADGKCIIANIWDLPATRDRNSIMIPKCSVDHTVVIFDYSYRSRVVSSGDKLIDLISKEHPDKQTVIFVGNAVNAVADKMLCKTYGIRYLKKDDVSDLVRDICLDTYRVRCYQVDKQIRELLSIKH